MEANRSLNNASVRNAGDGAAHIIRGLLYLKSSVYKSFQHCCHLNPNIFWGLCFSPGVPRGKKGEGWQKHRAVEKPQKEEGVAESGGGGPTGLVPCDSG